ncbi:hypothetical protein ACJX0J_028450, partial [Zea mays]
FGEDAGDGEHLPIEVASCDMFHGDWLEQIIIIEPNGHRPGLEDSKSDTDYSVTPEVDSSGMLITHPSDILEIGVIAFIFIYRYMHYHFNGIMVLHLAGRMNIIILSFTIMIYVFSN